MNEETKDKRENTTVSGAGNSIFAEVAGEGPGVEADENGKTPIEPEARQESTATIRSNELDDKEGFENKKA